MAPKRYLSTNARTGERPRLGYVPNAAYPSQVERFPGHFPATQEMLNEICAIQCRTFAVAREDSIRWIRTVAASRFRQAGAILAT